MNKKYFYVRNEFYKRAVTIVTKITPVGDDYKVEFAWAFCSNHDNFVKHLGRELVDARLNTKDSKYYSFFYINEKKSGKIKLQVLYELMKNINTPKKYLEDISWTAYEYMSTKPEVDIFASDISQDIIYFIDKFINIK